MDKKVPKGFNYIKNCTRKNISLSKCAAQLFCYHNLFMSVLIMLCVLYIFVGSTNNDEVVCGVSRELGMVTVRNESQK